MLRNHLQNAVYSIIYLWLQAQNRQFLMKNSLPPLYRIWTIPLRPRHRIGFRIGKAAPFASQQGRTDFPKEGYSPEQDISHTAVAEFYLDKCLLLVEAEIEPGQFWCTVPRNHHDTFLVSFIAPLERFAGQPDGTDLLAGLQRADYGRKRQTPLFRRYRFRFWETLQCCHSQTIWPACRPCPAQKELFRPAAQTKGNLWKEHRGLRKRGKWTGVFLPPVTNSHLLSFVVTFRF